jgi:hypothetical protein
VIIDKLINNRAVNHGGTLQNLGRPALFLKPDISGLIQGLALFILLMSFE